MSLTCSLTRIAQSVACKPNTQTLATCSGLITARRWYSPVRSRVHIPPPPRRVLGRNQQRAQQEQQEQQQFQDQLYEPQVQYSYPEVEKPPPGGVIQYSDGIANLLSQPVLVIERQIEFMNVFLVCGF